MTYSDCGAPATTCLHAPPPNPFIATRSLVTQIHVLHAATAGTRRLPPAEVTTRFVLSRSVIFDLSRPQNHNLCCSSGVMDADNGRRGRKQMMRTKEMIENYFLAVPENRREQACYFLARRGAVA